MRFSPELVQVKVFNYPPDTGVLTDLVQLLAGEQINLSFFSQDGSSGAHTSFCMTKTDFSKVANLIDDLLRPSNIEFVYIPSVGTLSLFPHQSRIKIVALMLSIFGYYNIPVYGLSSSISAIAVNTDYRLLDEAAEHLQQVFLLPEQHTPFRQHLPDSVANKEKATCQKRPMVETAATYWEDVIRIYGLTVKINLDLVTLNFPVDRMASLGNRLQQLETVPGRFELVVAHQVDVQNIQLVLLYQNDQEKSLSKILPSAAISAGVSYTVRSPVELLYLHGPHFQDRFGVANATLRALKKHQVNVLVTGCTGTSVYLVIPDKTAQTAAKALSHVFSVPVNSSTSQQIGEERSLH